MAVRKKYLNSLYFEVLGTIGNIEQVINFSFEPVEDLYLRSVRLDAASADAFNIVGFLPAFQLSIIFNTTPVPGFNQFISGAGNLQWNNLQLLDFPPEKRIAKLPKGFLIPAGQSISFLGFIINGVGGDNVSGTMLFEWERV